MTVGTGTRIQAGCKPFRPGEAPPEVLPRLCGDCGVPLGPAAVQPIRHDIRVVDDTNGASVDRISHIEDARRVPPGQAFVTPGKKRSQAAVILTASLTTNVARVAHGTQEATALINEILTTDHVDWETTLFVGEEEFYTTKDGPIPNHQLRISVRPLAGVAALNYMDHDDPNMSVANSFNPKRPLSEVHLIFNGSTGAVFPRTAAITISDARTALLEWLETWKRPTCIEWRPYDRH